MSAPKGVRAPRRERALAPTPRPPTRSADDEASIARKRAAARTAAAHLREVDLEWSLADLAWPDEKDLDWHRLLAVKALCGAERGAELLDRYARQPRNLAAPRTPVLFVQSTRRNRAVVRALARG